MHFVFDSIFLVGDERKITEVAATTTTTTQITKTAAAAT